MFSSLAERMLLPFGLMLLSCEFNMCWHALIIFMPSYNSLTIVFFQPVTWNWTPFFGPLATPGYLSAVKRSYIIGSVHPFILPSIFLLPEYFLEIVSLIFFLILVWYHKHVKLCEAAKFLRKNFFCPNNWKSVPKMHPKQGFFEFIEKFGF